MILTDFQSSRVNSLEAIDFNVYYKSALYSASSQMQTITNMSY